MATELAYKWLSGGSSCWGGSGQWRKGRWRSVRGEIIPCENGLHMCRAEHLLQWINSELWLAEAETDELIDHGDKIVVRRARVIEKLAWNDRTARLFAADCAERVLPIFLKVLPNDTRPADAIAAARAFANGEIDTAARAAAWATAGDAAGDAARDAARAAASDAAWAAAGDAARDAAWAAAGAAASDAAWAAARAAAGDAAWAAAWAAAGAAAGDAAREWQTARLLDYAHGRIG